jgi:hypothetical protein
MSGLKPFGIWTLAALVAGATIYAAQNQGFIPSKEPFWALGMVAVWALGLVRLLTR